MHLIFRAVFKITPHALVLLSFSNIYLCDRLCLFLKMAHIVLPLAAAWLSHAGHLTRRLRTSLAPNHSFSLYVCLLRHILDYFLLLLFFLFLILMPVSVLYLYDQLFLHPWF